MSSFKRIGVLAIVLAIAVVSYQVGRSDQAAGIERTMVPSLYAADANTYVGIEPGTLLPQGQQVASPTGGVADREVYYPGAEALEPGEMRVIACGIGMPKPPSFAGKANTSRSLSVHSPPNNAGSSSTRIAASNGLYTSPLLTHTLCTWFQQCCIDFVNAKYAACGCVPATSANRIHMTL